MIGEGILSGLRLRLVALGMDEDRFGAELAGVTERGVAVSLPFALAKEMLVLDASPRLAI